MDEWIAIDLGSGCDEDAGLFRFGQAKTVVGAEGTDFEGLDGYLQIVDGAGRGCKMQDVYQLTGNMDEFAYIVMIEFRRSPVMRLSMPMTWKPSLMNRSQRCDPRNPAAPVINTRCLLML
jgi:hypothetical protein